MATKLQTVALQGRRAVATQFCHELARLEGPACRAYGGRAKLDADYNYRRGQRDAYDSLLKLAKADKF